MIQSVQELLFELLEEAGIVTTKDIARILEISPAQVRKHAAQLMMLGRIQGHKDRGSWVYWHPDAADEEGNVKESGTTRG